MEQKKTERFRKTLLKRLSNAVKKELDLDPQIFITFTRIEFSLDKHQARIYASIFPESKQKETLKLLQKSSKELVVILQKQIKTRYIPYLHFQYDPGIARSVRIEQLLNKNRQE